MSCEWPDMGLSEPQTDAMYMTYRVQRELSYRFDALTFDALTGTPCEAQCHESEPHQAYCMILYDGTRPRRP